MNDAIEFDGVRYVSSAEAAQRAALGADYIALLARQGKVRARQVARKWYVDPLSLDNFLAEQTALKEKRSAELSAEFRSVAERTALARAIAPPPPPAQTDTALAPADFFHKLAAATLALALTFGAAMAASPSARTFAEAAINRISEFKDGIATLAAANAPFENPNSATPAASTAIPNTAQNSLATSANENPSQTVVATPVETATSYGTTNPSVAYAATSAPQPGAYAEATSLLPTPEPAFDASAFVTEAQLQSSVSALGDSLRQLIQQNYQQPLITGPQAPIAAVNFAPSQQIDQLSGTTLSNVTVNGVSGLTASEIPALDYFAATDTISIAYGGTGTSTAPSYGQLLLGNGNGGYTLVATSSLGISGGGGATNPGGSDTEVEFNSGGTFTGSGSFTFASSTNLLTVTNASTTNLTATYASTSNFVASNSFTLGNFTGFLKATAGAVSTALVNLASDVTGILPVANGGTGWSNIAAGAIPFGNGTGALATTSAGTAGYVLAYLNSVPTWTATSTLATISGVLNLASQVTGTLGASNGGTGSTTLSGILKGNGTGAIRTAIGGTDYEFPLTFSAPLSRSTNTISLPQASGSQSGYLASSDWTTFNDKIASTSLSAIYPLAYNSGTGVFTLGFGTTTSNTWSGTQTFSNISATNATTSSLYVTGITSRLLKTDANGQVIPAIAGTDYQTAGNYLTALGNYATTTGASISLSTSTVTANGQTLGLTAAVSASGILLTPTITGTLNNSGLTNSTIGATSPNSTLSFGAAAALGSTFTADLNLGNANWWTAAQNFTDASTSELTATSTVWFTNLTNALLATDQNGKLIATTTIGTNLLAGVLGTVNGTALSAGGSITVTAASSTLLGDTNTFSGNDSFTNASSNFGGTWQTFSPSHFQTAGTYLIALGNYATTTGTAISLSTSTVTADGQTLGLTVAVSASGILLTPTISGTLTNAGLAHSTIVLNGTTLTLGDSGDTVTAASSTALADNNAFSGNDTFNNTITGSISGNANTATTFQTSRTINGTSFNGGSNITITAASSTLLGDNNNWTGLQQFTNVSTSLFSAYGPAYFGATATSTFASNGALTTPAIIDLGASSFANSDNFFGLTSFGATGTTTITAAGAISTPSIIATNATGFSASFGATATSTFDSAGDLSLAGTLSAQDGGTLAGTFAGSPTFSGTPIFSSGFLSQASTTIGNGTQTGGLTIMGGATTTGNIIGQGTLALTGTLSAQGLGTFASGFVSQASSTIVGTLTLTGTLLAQGATFSSTLAAQGGGSLTGTFTGSPTFSGTPTFSSGLLSQASSTVVGNFTTTGTLAAGTLNLTNALTVGTGGTGAATFGQGWIYSTGGTNALAASTSPTVNYLVATSSTQYSIFTDGLFSLASTTIGNGTQAGGLTISGGATTTGNIVGQGSLTLTGTLSAQGATFNNALTASNGGTGISNPSAAGVLLGSYAGGSWQQLATSSLGIKLTDLVGTLGATQGGSGQSAVTTGDLLYGSGTNAWSRLAIGTGGYVLGVVNGIPGWVATTTLANISGTLAVGSGGTGATTLTGLLQGNGTSPITAITGTAGQFPYYNGTNTLLATSSLFLSTAGNVGVGTTNPSALLALNGGSSASTSLALMRGSTQQTVPTTWAAADEGRFSFYQADSSGGFQRYLDIMSNGAGGSASSNIRFMTNNGASTPVEAMRITGAGNVGIGTTSPVSTLAISGGAVTIGANSFLNFQTAGVGASTDYWIGQGGALGGGTLAFYAPSGDGLEWGIANMAKMVMDPNGNVGIGETGPGRRLEVTNPSNSNEDAFGAIQNNTGGYTAVFGQAANGSNAGYFTVTSGPTCYLASGSSWTCSSDARIKQNIVPVASTTDALSDLMQLIPISYTFKADASNTPQLGFLAQNVQQEFPQLVSTSTATTTWTPNGTLTLQYDGLIAPIVAAIQDIANISSTFQQNLIAWLGNASNGIGDLYATAIHAATGDFSTGNFSNELCVGSTCVTPAQFQAMVAAANASQSSGKGSGSTSVSDASATSDTPPIIQINGDNPAIIQIGETYNDLGATITGPQADLNLGIETYLNGTLTSNIVIDTSNVATDTIDYVATDQSGLTATSTRTVIIEPSPSIIPTTAASSTADTAGQGSATDNTAASSTTASSTAPAQ